MKFAVRTKEDLEGINGVVVAIDVLRAFSTACYILERKPRSLMIIDDKEYCLSQKKKNPALVLVGEHNGVMHEGFDYNNSPTQVSKARISGKDVILMTTAGTKTMTRIPEELTVFTGSFVNALSTVEAIKKLDPALVTFVPTSHKYLNNEDFQCAAYMKSLLEGRALDFNPIKKIIRAHPLSHGFLVEPGNKYSRKDYAMCLKENIFPFAIVRVHKNNQYYLQRSDV